MAFRVKNLKIQRQEGTEDTFYATWEFSDVHLKGYKLRWAYSTGDNVWFLGSNSEIDDLNSIQATYTPPENAITIRLDVQPVSTTRDVNGVETAWFIGEWVTAYFDIYLYDSPPKPSVPTVALDDYYMTVSIDNYDSGVMQVDLYICFYVFKHTFDADTGQAMTREPYKSARVPIKYGRASYRFSIDAGSGYSVRASLFAVGSG